LGGDCGKLFFIKMSFHINWPQLFSPEFMDRATQQFTKALNTASSKPDNIQGEIIIEELSMGTHSPELEIMEITELNNLRFKGLFRLSYNGNAFVVLKTQVQVNPLYTKRKRLQRTIFVADEPLVVPMKMKISNLVLKGIILLAVDKEKGCTLVFKNDPLESVLINSTFNNTESIKQRLQSEIEKVLRSLFQEKIPQIVHNLSKITTKTQSYSKDITEPIGEEKSESFVPHHLKWRGTDPIYGYSSSDCDYAEGYILYRSLSVDKVDGLQRLV
jgi:hypothetical protein